MTARIRNLEILDRKKKDLQRVKVEQQVYTQHFMIAIRETIARNFTNEFPDWQKHFDVNVYQNGKRWRVAIVVDEIGGYLYEGTPDHDIVAGPGSAIPWGDPTIFSAHVHNPGIVARKPQIDKMVNKSLTEARAIMQPFGTYMRKGWLR